MAVESRPRPLPRPDRAAAPALDQLRKVLRHLLADHHVQPVAGLDPGRSPGQDRLAASHDHADQRLARKPQLSDPEPGDRVAVADHVLDHLGARARGSFPSRRAAAGSAGSAVVTPSAWASGSKVVPWTMVEMTTAKKTMLKYSRLLGTPLITGKVASTTGTAPRSPAQPEDQPLAGAVAIEGGGERRGQRPSHERDHQGDQGSVDQHVAELAREDEQPEGEEERDLGHPGEALVEGGDGALGRDVGAAERQPRQVHGQEAGAVDDRRAAVGEPGGGDRGHRVEAGGLQVQAPEGPDRARPHGHAPRPGRCRARARTARPCRRCP